jgi:hypothetical protein
MTATPRLTTPEERAPLYAAYQAARNEAEEVGGSFTDDSIIQAAVKAYAAELTAQGRLLPAGADVHHESGRRRSHLAEWTPVVGVDETDAELRAGIGRWIEAGHMAQRMQREVRTWPDSDSVVYGDWEPVETYPATTEAGAR